jgi:hypothetical protein
MRMVSPTFHLEGTANDFLRKRVEPFLIRVHRCVSVADPPTHRHVCLA